MAKAYNVGDRLYLPVWITNKESNLVMYKDNNELVTDAKFSYVYSQGETRSGEVRYGEPDLLLTAEEIYASRRMVDEVEHLTDMLDYGRKKYDEIEELKARNAELEALLKEVMATRDEAIKQNDELIAENKKLKAENGAWQVAAQTCADNAKVADKATEELRKENKDLKAKVAENADTISRLSANKVALTEEVARLRETIADRTIDVQHLTEENANLKAWYEEANKTASEAAEANDDLKAKIADLRNRVGEQLAQIQDLNAEVHFHKEFGEGVAKQQEELRARYDELDSVNKEQAEKIRRQDKALTDLKKRNDDLQAENTNLTFLLEDAPEKETTKTLHVVLNDGTEIEFRRYTAYDYRTDINMFVVKDGERYIAGFLRGDKPMNLAYWWTE